MANRIGWCDETLNIITGCTAISEGCQNCYARRMANRLQGRFGYPADAPFAVTFHPDKLDYPKHWRKPRRIFLNSMSDWVHEDVKLEWFADIIEMIKNTPRHTYKTLTKRPGELRLLLGSAAQEIPQLQLGATVELQKYCQRIGILNDTFAHTRFVCFEPLLGDITVPWQQMRHLDQIIIGVETVGARNASSCARPCRLEWVESLVRQAQEVEVPIWVKTIPDQSGRPCEEIGQFPQHLQLRQEPR